MSATTTIEQPASGVGRIARVRGKSRFFLWTAIALAITVLWGFGPTYFFRAFITTRDLTPVIHVHGFVFTCWIALFMAQTALVSTRRTDIHRRLGIGGIAVAAAVVATGIAVELVGTADLASRWNAVNGPLASSSYLIEASANHILFGLLVLAAIWWRKRSESHKRLMVIATITLMSAPVARILDEFGWPITVGPFGFGAPGFGLMGRIMPPNLTAMGFLNLIVAPFFLALVVYDLTRTGRIHRATVFGGLALFLFHPAVSLIARR